MSTTVRRFPSIFDDAVSGSSTLQKTREITCIKRDESRKRIESIGGGWGTTTVNEAIEDIENNRFIYVVREAGKAIPVSVGRTSNGGSYLKTENDGERSNNLSSLKECS